MVILWSAATAQVVAALPGHNNDLIKLAFSQVTVAVVKSYLNC